MYPIVGTRVRNGRYARTQWSVRARGIVFTRVNMVWVSEISVTKISSFFVKFGFLYRKFIINLKIPKIRCWNFGPRNSEFRTSKFLISNREIPNFQPRNSEFPGSKSEHHFHLKIHVGWILESSGSNWIRFGNLSLQYNKIMERIRFLRAAMPSV